MYFSFPTLSASTCVHTYVTQIKVWLPVHLGTHHHGAQSSSRSWSCAALIASCTPFKGTQVECKAKLAWLQPWLAIFMLPSFRFTKKGLQYEQPKQSCNTSNKVMTKRHSDTFSSFHSLPQDDSCIQTYRHAEFKRFTPRISVLFLLNCFTHS